MDGSEIVTKCNSPGSRKNPDDDLLELVKDDAKDLSTVYKDNSVY